MTTDSSQPPNGSNDNPPDGQLPVLSVTEAVHVLQAKLKQEARLWGGEIETVDGSGEFPLGLPPAMLDAVRLSSIQHVLANPYVPAMEAQAEAEHPNDPEAQADRLDVLMSEVCDRFEAEARRLLPELKRRLAYRAHLRAIGKDNRHGGTRVDATPIYKQVIRLGRAPARAACARRTLRRSSARTRRAQPTRRRGSRRSPATRGSPSSGDPPGDSDPEGPGGALGGRTQLDRALSAVAR